VQERGERCAGTGREESPPHHLEPDPAKSQVIYYREDKEKRTVGFQIRYEVAEHGFLKKCT
jgi:hypothetical protein